MVMKILIFLLGVTVGLIGMSLYHIKSTQPNISEEAQELIGEGRLAFASHPLYIVLEEDDRQIQSGRFILYGFNGQNAVFSFAKEQAERLVFNAHVLPDFSARYSMAGDRSEALVHIGEAIQRDLNGDGIWDVVHDMNGMTSRIRIREDEWLQVEGFPKRIDDIFQATAADGQVFRFMRENGEWILHDGGANEIQ